ncbi:glycerophosphodiester phosphodiesterase family protein [Wenzhouxiangella sp. XN79A]|uniref:glycerophosphodiester phosphodiesterase family protein n=1 Tax=Wenzhouxiangella sp. XN79A TaxID=2724193 RepID=UPI00144AF03C|nr:glycerophosphodiester phosphodiesterase family protein [Wenzhouxiangella sp. XN79A]NKI35172.1 glycerophosphodiester phosphodiesterase family protein [Wenzhouxiangella sp. XN79A]
MRSLFAAVLALLLAACSLAPTSQRAPQADRWLQGIDLAAYLDCAREQSVTLLQAHRAGDRPGAAENSLGAIEASLADGAVFLEIDVARTADGVLVLMHDRTVDRTTNGQGIVTEMTAAEFAALQLEDLDGDLVAEAPPTLAAALAALDGRGIAQIDLKGIDIATIARAIEQAGAVDRSIVITYSIDDAIELHRRLPDLMFSVGLDDESDLKRLVDAGVDLTRVTAWLGTGTGNPPLDAQLAERGIETSYGDFRGERAGTADYRLLADNGAEVISVDDVPAAAAALRARDRARDLLASCPAARPSE